MKFGTALVLCTVAVCLTALVLTGHEETAKAIVGIGVTGLFILLML